MKASTRKLEIRFNRLKNRKAKQGTRLFKAMFSRIYKDFLSYALTMQPNNWADAAKLIKEEDVRKTFRKYYPMFADLGLMMRKHLVKEKSEDDFWINSFEFKLEELVTSQAGEKIVSITNTTKKELAKVVQETLSVVNEEGLGIDEAAKMLEKNIGKNLKGNAAARARAIAQTEMISASNQASMFAAQSTGLETRKFWSTSGLAGVRESHTADQSFSDRVNGLKDDEVFPSTGLLFPGDPNGAADEIINCRCTLLHEVI